MENYRIFFVYRIKNLGFLHVHGMNMETKRMFTLLLPSPNDRIDLSSQEEQLPSELINKLEMERHLIDSGHYDIAQWEPYSYS